MALAQIKRDLEVAGSQPQDSLCRRFVPDHLLSDILTLNRLVEALRDSAFNIPEHKRTSTASLIIEEPAQKIFAILVEIHCEGCLVSFLESDYADRSLPLGQSILDTVIPSGSSLFARVQHDFLVYSFRRGQFHRTLRDSQTLPFLKQDSIGGGGSSLVYRALVHPLHQNFVKSSANNPVVVVRKQLNPSPGNGKAEAELLYLLGSLRHRNIVEILTSYVQHGVSNLLFFPADMDLHDLLLKPEKPAEFTQIYQLLQALQGLASGLAYLHNFKLDLTQSGGDTLVMIGYHHDIKPRNILIRGSTFVLADFGEAKLKKSLDDSKTRWKDTTFEYGPPECRDPESFEPQLVGRALDIWSLGCIASEVLAYAEGGSSNLIAFRSKRVQKSDYGTTRCFHDGEKLSSAVSHFLNTVVVSSASRSLSQLSKLLRKAFSTSPLDRPKAEELRFLLSCLVIEDLLDHIMGSTITDPSEQTLIPSRHLSIMRFMIEKCRLLAWANNLGFRSIGDSDTSYRRKYDGLAPEFTRILLTALSGSTSTDAFPDSQQNESLRLQTLRVMNDDLCEHLDEEMKVSVDETFQILLLERSFGSPEPLLAGINVIKDQANNLGALAAMKYMSLLLERKAVTPSRSYRIESSLMREDPRWRGDKSSPNVWLYAHGHEAGQEKKVIVEFVKYWWPELENFDKRDFEAAVESIFEQLGQLVELLRKPPGRSVFLSLDCIGAFHDVQQKCWGLVYDFPTPGSSPVCLNSLMRHGRSCAMVPDLQQKLTLAKKLSTCVQSYHTSGWIHKNISSRHVLFFSLVEDYKLMDLDEPFLVGFDYSRPDSTQAYSAGIFDGRDQEYLHPSYRKGLTRATPSYDYYSLGLILLEIGTWTSISNVYGDRRNLTLSPMGLRDLYIAWCKNDLSKTMGPVYQQVTLACLEFLSELDPLKERLKFQTEVVDKLKTINL